MKLFLKYLHPELIVSFQSEFQSSILTRIQSFMLDIDWFRFKSIKRIQVNRFDIIPFIRIRIFVLPFLITIKDSFSDDISFINSVIKT